MTTTDTFQGMTAEQWATEYMRLVQETQEQYQHINDRQKRDAAERETIYAIENAEGEIVHQGSDYDTAHMAQQLAYDDGHVVYQTRTPWKRLTATTTSTEAQLAESDDQ